MIAYLECFAGAAGDMILAGLIDAGADLDFVSKQIRLCVPEAAVEPREVTRRGLRAVHLEVTGGERRAFGRLEEAEEILEQAGLDDEVGRPAREVLRRLAGAEGRVHGTDPAEVVFHELGAADTLIDAVGVAAAFSSLEVDEITASPVAAGFGTVAGEHGPLPVPAPATMELLRGAPLRSGGVAFELVTPTGAAILATFSSGFGEMPSMRLRSVGYGAGSADLEIPNILRVSVGERVPETVPTTDEILIETNIDDMSPELFPYVSERLFASGAADVWLTPAIGKHGRPSHTLSVLAQPPLEKALRDVLLRETTALGFRILPIRKWMAHRRFVEVLVEGLPVKVKIAEEAGEIVNVAPEYADCLEVARTTGLPLKEVFRRALGAFEA